MVRRKPNSVKIAKKNIVASANKRKVPDLGHMPSDSNNDSLIESLYELLSSYFNLNFTYQKLDANDTEKKLLNTETRRLGSSKAGHHISYLNYLSQDKVVNCTYDFNATQETTNKNLLCRIAKEE